MSKENLSHQEKLLPEEKLSPKEELLLVKQKYNNNKNFLMDFILFIINIVILLPLWFCILLPITILYFLYSKFSLICCPRRSEKKQTPNLTMSQSIRPKKSRKFDVIVYGATGFTGRQVTDYIVKQYSNSQLVWAIAGRSMKGLTEITKKYPDFKITVKETASDEQLEELVNDTRVILTTVGPYALLGTKMVELCANYGTDYVDITGEVAWVREMIVKYDELAFKNNSRIVNCCGCDSIPWDITTYLCAQELKKNGEDLSKIEFFDYIKSKSSGGTIATLINSLENPPKKSQFKYDPLFKINGKEQQSDIKMKTSIQRFLGYSSKMKSWIGLWFLADGNSCIVKRSNALANYGHNMLYREQLVYNNFFHGFNFQISTLYLGTCVFNKWIRNLCMGICLPKPGQGPTEDGYMILKAFATGSQGTKKTAQITFPVDPGYKDTARMIVESALCFIFNEKEISQEGGFLTTAVCFKEALIKRLISTGSTFLIE